MRYPDESRRYPRTYVTHSNQKYLVTLSGPSSLDFGVTWAGVPVHKYMRLSNTCNSPIDISDIAFYNAAYTLLSAVPLRIAPYSSTHVGVQLPSHVEGFPSATLMVRSNAHNAPNLAIPVSGRVNHPPRLSVSPAQLSGTAPPTPPKPRSPWS